MINETFAQYRDREVRELSGWSGLPMTEVRECYPEKHWELEYYKAIVLEAQTGGELCRAALDWVGKRENGVNAVTQLVKSARGKLDWYLPPDVRNQKRDIRKGRR